MQGSSEQPGFYKLPMAERLKLVQKLTGLTDEELKTLSNTGGLPGELADRMIENVIGGITIPLGDSYQLPDQREGLPRPDGARGGFGGRSGKQRREDGQSEGRLPRDEHRTGHDRPDSDGGGQGPLQSQDGPYAPQGGDTRQGKRAGSDAGISRRRRQGFAA